MPSITIRPFTDTDAETTADLFFRAIHEGTRDHYTPEQRSAWAPDRPDTDRWRDKLRAQYSISAEIDGMIAGFMTLTDDGCIDLAFVDPNRMGQGIGTALLNHIMAEAALRGLNRVATHASLAARPFFERHGWQVIKQQTVTRKNVPLTNFLMETTVQQGQMQPRR